MKKQLLLIAMILLPMVASSHSIAVQNADGVTIYYNYTNDGTELAVTYCGSSSKEYHNEYKGNVVIPEEVTYMNRTRKVTSINKEAFFQCSDLTAVTIPKSVTSIGEDAFRYCSGLKKVIVLDIAAWCGVNFGNTYANPLYYARHLYSDEKSEIKDLVIPNSVMSIGNYAFYYCSDLTSVTIPNSLTRIGEDAFSYCYELKKVIVSDIVAWCGIIFRNSTANPLYHARHLYSDENTEIKDLIIPNSVASIGEYAFYNSSGLTSVTISNSVMSIGDYAFSGWNLPVVISLIENPFSIYGGTFSNNTFMNATLYVPVGTIDKYKTTEGWKNFLFIEEGTGGGGGTTPEKCVKPTIGYSNGKLTFTSSTEGATCYYLITDSDIKSGSGNEVQLGVTYNISVYAAKAGYENSETATATLCWIDASPKTEGITNGVAQIAARPVLVKTDNGFITVEGMDDRTNVSVYTTDGKQVGSAISQNNTATIATSIQPGSIAIVKVGEKSVKVIMK